MRAMVRPASNEGRQNTDLKRAVLDAVILAGGLTNAGAARRKTFPHYRREGVLDRTCRCADWARWLRRGEQATVR